jgi:Pectate lyase superfamily protein
MVVSVIKDTIMQSMNRYIVGVGAVGLLLAQGCLAQQTMPGVAVVTAYGATGNGQTDDTRAIQAAENAVEAMPGCGTVMFPPGNYVINSGPVRITKYSCRWEGSGGISYSESPPGGATLLTDTANQDIVDVATRDGSLGMEGPSFENLNFFARSNIRTQRLLHINNWNRGHIRHCAFRNGAAGVYFEGADDDSDWVIEGNSVFYNNVVGVDHAVSPEGGGDNAIINSYIGVDQADDVGIRLQSNNAQARISGNHFDGSYQPGVIGVSTLANQVVITGNDFEGVPTAVQIPPPVISNDGRGTRIIGNHVTGNCYTPLPAWLSPANFKWPVVIALNTYICVPNAVDGE